MRLVIDMRKAVVDFEAAIKAGIKGMGMEISTIMQRFGKRMAISLAHGTLPFGFDESAKTNLEKKITGDVYRVFPGRSGIYDLIKKRKGEGAARSFWKVAANPSAANQSGGIEFQQRKGGKKIRAHYYNKLLRETGISPIMKVDPSIHRAARTGEYRRVPKDYQSGHFVVGLKAGPQTYSNRKARMAGFAKSGWKAAADNLKGSGVKRGFPQWVSRHATKKSQHGEGKFSAMGEFGPWSVMLTNKVSYASEVLDQGKIDQAKVDAMRSIREHLQKALPGAFKKGTRAA